MTLNERDLHRLFSKCAKSALAEWYSGQFNVQEQELDNLTGDLWVWYLESPSVQSKLEASEPALARKLVVMAALKRLARAALDDDTFSGKALFSSDSVKESLKGRSTNKYLKAILPIAWDAVQHKDDHTPGRQYAEALRKRYQDKVFPANGTEKMRLHHAVRALTDEVNINYLTTDVEGIGSGNVMYPGLRKRNGEHGDPTGNTALMLMDNPELAVEYLEPTAWQQITCGAASEPTYDLGRARIRPAAGSYPNWMLLKHPELEDVYVDAKREELGW